MGLCFLLSLLLTLCRSYCGFCCDPGALGPVDPALLFLPKDSFTLPQLQPPQPHVNSSKTMSLVSSFLLDFCSVISRDEQTCMCCSNLNRNMSGLICIHWLDLSLPFVFPGFSSSIISILGTLVSIPLFVLTSVFLDYFLTSDLPTFSFSFMQLIFL